MPDNTLEVIPKELCLELLGSQSVGRIAVIDAGYPIVVPVNYRLVSSEDQHFISIRTRPGNVIDRSGPPVAFEIDGIDHYHHTGWSVVVRGTLHHLIDLDRRGWNSPLDPQPWIEDERDAWLLIEPQSITGRRLRPNETEWAFHIRAYL
jgi:hypothetical protein